MVCTCGNIRIGLEVTELKSLDPDCPEHGVGGGVVHGGGGRARRTGTAFTESLASDRTDYWNSPKMVERRRSSVEWQRKAAEARRKAREGN
jgi:hypothetical protein